MRLAAARRRLLAAMLFAGAALLAGAACLPERLHDVSLQCEGGSCHCAPGRGNCNGDWSDGCEEHLDRSAQHCGGCGLHCSHGSCQQGQCVCDEIGGRADCDGSAANGCEVGLLDDDANCGACGRACEDGWVCQDGACQERCPAGAWCADQCFDTTRDRDHCGSCSHVCASAEACFASTCVACDELCGVCLTRDLGQAVPALAGGPATTDGVRPSCWLDEVSGAAYLWRAPTKGSYLVSTFGSEADTVLAVHGLSERQCKELSCRLGTAGEGATVEIALPAAAPVLVEVATPAAPTAQHSLHITPMFDAACALTWLGWSLPVFESGSFDGASDVLDASCAPPGGPEVAFKLIAPAKGIYLADTSGSQADTVLYALSESCDGAPLGCDDHSGVDDAKLALDLEAGEAVVLVVERRSGSPPGDFVLHLEGPY